MDFDTIAREASLGVGLAIRPPAPGAPAVRPPTPDKPAEVLAALMDFSGGVALAELLQAPVRGGPPNPDASRLGYDLQERVQSQLDAMSTLALQRLQRDRRAESDIVVAELRELITSANLGSDRGVQPATALRIATELRKRVGWRLGASMRQAQSDLARLRANIAAELRRLGPRAAQLERIDAALETSLQHKLADLYDRVLRAAEQNFDRACVDACSGLQEGFGEADLTGWLASSGWIARDRDRCERTIGAFCVHLRRGLEGLVMAAIQAEVGS